MGTIVLLSFLLSSFSGHQMFASGSECGTRFTDFSSSAVLAEVVLQGSVTEFQPYPSARNEFSANVNVSAVFKGMDILKTTGRMTDRKHVVVQSFGQENRDNCVAPVAEKFKHQDMVFFLRQSPDIRMMELSAFPLPVEGDEDQRIKRSLCETCIQPPTIMRLNCRNCTREPTIKPMKSKKATMGRRARLRCIARGKPAPTITWSKDDVPIRSGSGGVTIRTTGLTSTLHFSRTTSAHGGRYKCFASNEVGNVEGYVTLEVIRKSRTRSKAAAPSSVKDAADKVECQTNLCLNGGTCFFSASLNLRQCVCPSSFEGVRCENAQSLNVLHDTTRSTTTGIKAPTTSQMGIIKNMMKNATAQITEKTTSVSDTETVREAEHCTRSGRCLNRGTCLLNSELGVWYCLCPSQYNGPRCEFLEMTIQSAIENKTVNVHSTPETTTSARTTTATTPLSAVKPQMSNHVSPTRDSHSRVPNVPPPHVNPRPTSRYSSNGQRLPTYPVRKKSSLKIIPCREKTYCLNKGKCRFIRKLNKKFCQCRSGYGGLRCERVL